MSSDSWAFVPHVDELIQVEQQPGEALQPGRIVLEVATGPGPLRRRRRAGEAESVAEVHGRLADRRPIPFAGRSANFTEALSISSLFIMNRPCGAVTVWVRRGRGAAVIHVERLEESWHDVPVGRIAADHIGRPAEGLRRRVAFRSRRAARFFATSLRRTGRQESDPSVPAAVKIESQIGSASSRCSGSAKGRHWLVGFDVQCGGAGPRGRS